MRPYFPDKMNFKSDNDKVTLLITKKKEAFVNIRSGFLKFTKYKWKNEIYYPSIALINTKIQKIFLIGGHGDPGCHLGEVSIYNYDGKIITKLNLKETLENLEKISRDYGQMGNFPWVHTHKFINDNKILELNICNKFIINIDPTGKITKNIKIEN